MSFLQLCNGILNRLPIPNPIRESIRKIVKKMIFSRQYLRSIQTNNVNTFDQTIDINSSIDASCCGFEPKLVSVILPVYNQADLLKESIESVLAQTYRNFELIIINDGSKDGVENILSEYLNHPQIKCFTQMNQRLPKALSNGFEFATGEFWTWTSADNIMEPNMLESLVNKLQSDPSIGMVYGDYYAIDDRGDILQDLTWRSHNRPNPDSGEIRLPRTTQHLNNIQDNFIGPCFMYRGWIGKLIGDYDPQLGIEDYDYWMRINSFFKISHVEIDNLLYKYRVHDNTLSAQAVEHKILDKVQVLMNYESERSKFYNQAFNVISDSACTKLLQVDVDGFEINHQIINDENILSLTDSNQYDLILLTSESAIHHLDALKKITIPIAIVIHDHELHYQKLLSLFKTNHCVALVNSAKTAARIRLISKTPILDIKSTQTIFALKAFAKNTIFFKATREAKDLERTLPSLILSPEKKHILLQVDSFTNGGMENVVIDLGLSLQTLGFKVTIGNLGISGDMALKAEDKGLKVENFPKNFSQDNYRAWLKNNKVNIVNAHYSLYGAEMCQQENIPFIETIHNSYVWLDPKAKAAYTNADQYISKYICVSNTAAKYADICLELDVEKMQVIRNGIDSENIDLNNFENNRLRLRNSWNVDEYSPVFLNVASIMATKAQLPLIKAFSKVVEKIPTARLVLLGSVMEKNYFQEIEKTIQEMSLADNVIIAGYHRDVAAYYHAADFFVLPSFWEGWSLSLGEAVANGLACIITNVGSAYEFVDDESVKIISPPFGDITQLNYFNLNKYLYTNNDDFNNRLAEAMLSMFEQIDIENRSLNSTYIKEFDSELAYKKYAEIFVSIN